jgi:hypothetical protein
MPTVFVFNCAKPSFLISLAESYAASVWWYAEFMVCVGLSEETVSDSVFPRRMTKPNAPLPILPNVRPTIQSNLFSFVMAKDFSCKNVE